MEEQKNLGRSIINNLNFFIAGIALTVLVFVTFFGVFARYFLGSPFAWEEEVQLACFVWITFLGVGAAFRTGSHVAIEIVVERLPKKIARWIELGGYVISMGILLFFFYYSDVIVYSMVQMGRSTNILHIPNAVIYLVVPVGCILMMYNYTRVIIKKFKEVHD